MKIKIKKIEIITLAILVFIIPSFSFGDNYSYHNVHTISPVSTYDHESATLSGSATLTKSPVYGYFRYSPVSPESVTPIFCNEVFGDDMKSTNEIWLGYDPNNDNPGESSRKTFSIDISDLDQDTDYYFCAVASDAHVIEYGPVSTFHTKISPDIGSSESSLSSIETKPATLVTSNSASINGFFNSAVASETWFEYRQKRTYQDLLNATVSEIKTATIASNLFSLNTNSNINNLTSSTQSFQSSSIANTSNTVHNSSTILTTTPSSAAIATIATQVKQNPYNWSGKINVQQHALGTNGLMTAPLKNLEKNKTYEFRAVIKTNITGNNPTITYGSNLTFRTSNSDVSNGDVKHDEDSSEDINTDDATNTNLTLGQTITPPIDATVHYHEGIETVFARQIMKNSDLAEMYGYQQGDNLENFAWQVADFFARTFGYIGTNGKEIRVIIPDIAAYQLKLVDGNLTVYEYYDSKIVNIQSITSLLRKNYDYEYYFTKK